MTELNHPARQTPLLPIAAVALTASFLGAALGGVAGNRAEAFIRAEADAQAVRIATAAAAEQAKWAAYGAQWLHQHQQQSGELSARDGAVLRAAQEWEARHRQMYPTVPKSARDQAVLRAAQEWEARYRQMYPTVPKSARDQAVLRAAQEWEARYRQMYPTVPKSARDQAVLRAAQEWEARYRQMYPESQ